MTSQRPPHGADPAFRPRADGRFTGVPPMTPARNAKIRPSRRRARGRAADSPPAPTRVAAIDCGATSVRMLVVEVHPDGTQKVLERIVHPIALGADTFRVGHIRPQTLRALGQVLRNLRQVLRELDVNVWRAIGTSAIRDATNSDVVTDRLHHASGIRLALLEASEESRIAYGQLLPFLRDNRIPGRRHVLVIDLGGGSTEILLLRGERVVLGETSRLGVARLLYGAASPERAGSEAYLETTIRSAVTSTREVLRGIEVGELVAVNSALGAALANDRRARKLSGGLAISASDLARIHAEVEALSPQELRARFQVSLSVAELLHPALTILRRFVEITRVERVLLTEVDVLAGLVQEVLRDLRGESPLAVFRRQIVGSVEGILDKFGADRRHAEKVRQLSVELFEALGRYLDLNEKDGLLLELAALLHDIGRFISDRDHHKHSLYLVNWTEIVGLSERDRRLIGMVARYHRKGRPRPEHIEYGSLSPENRMRVSKLAALLRLADAMDRSHRQLVRHVVVGVGESELDLAADAASDITVEAEAIRLKSNLISDLTGLTVRFRRILA